MAPITRNDITITVKYEVDCKVCLAGVEPDEEFYDEQEVGEAVKRHIKEHGEGHWGK